jgi:hypothetical protein
MILTRNRIIHHEALTREDYLNIKGTSFSGLKDIKFEENFGMKIGSLVHKYILKPSEYNYEHIEIVRPIANSLIDFCGLGVIRGMVAEVPVSCDFIYDDFSFRWKGIPDLFLDNILVIDFKVLSGGLKFALDRYNYKEQLRGYMKSVNAPRGLILSFNKLTKKIEHFWVLPDDSWWCNIIITRGNVLYHFI